MQHTLHLERDGPVAELTLPGRHGALGPDFWRELPAALAEAATAHALILRPAGEHFSVGLDLHATTPLLAGMQGQPARFLELLAGMQGAVEALANFPAPVVVALSGWCIGAGLELAAAADLRVCSREARFSLPEVRLGIVSDLGGLARLPHLIGEGWTRRLALTGEHLDAGRAEQLGLVSEVLPSPQEALERARELARAIAQLPPLAVQGTKRNLNARLEAQVSAHYRETGAWNAAFLDPRHLARKENT